MKTLAALGFWALLAASPTRADDGHHHGNGPRPGRYVGNLVFAKAGFRIPVQIDFTKMDLGGEYTRMSGVMKLFVGGPTARETLTYYYPDVDLLPDNKIAMADSANDLRGAALALFSDTVSGEMTSTYGGVAGRLWVQQVTADEEEADIDEPGDEEPIVAEFKEGQGLPILPAIAGDRVGTCGGRPARLTLANGRPVTGSLTLGTDGNQVVRVFRNGAFSPFLVGRDALRLDGMACRVEARALHCDEACEFPSAPSGAAEWKSFRRLVHVERTADEKKPLSAAPLPTDVAGVFSGFLHDETSDTYRPIEIRMDAYVDGGTLYVGGERGAERFDYRPFQSGGTTMTFVGSAGTLLRVITWSKGFLRAVWHTKTGGRVGTLEAVRGRVPPPKRPN